MVETILEADFILGEAHVRRDQEGRALVVTPDVVDSQDGCVSVRLESWDDTKAHSAVSEAIGKRVKILVIVEEVPDDG